jgi:hypothetical protein
MTSRDGDVVDLVGVGTRTVGGWWRKLKRKKGEGARLQRAPGAGGCARPVRLWVTEAGRSRDSQDEGPASTTGLDGRRCADAPSRQMIPHTLNASSHASRCHPARNGSVGYRSLGGRQASRDGACF